MHVYKAVTETNGPRPFMFKKDGLRSNSADAKVGRDARTDDDIEQACRDALEMSAAVGRAIKVMVSDGWVTLSGDVDSGYQRWTAEEIASRVSGVIGINGQIKVRLPSEPAADDRTLS